MMISRERAVVCGLAAIVGVIAIQSFSSFSCYGHTIQDFFGALGIFLMVPLLPALISLCTKNPLRAVGACLLFAPWLLFAYYTDCVCPYTGGGASMVYVVVLLWGTPCAIIGAVLTDPILRALGISVAGC
jgi:hypothetical protein